MEEIAKANHYRSYYEVAKKITNPEARLAFYDAIDAYRFEGELPENLPFEADLAFTAIKANIDADVNRKQGGAPKNNKNAQKKQPKNNLKTTVVLEKTNNEKEEVEEKEEVNEKAKVEGEVEVKDNENVEENPFNPLEEPTFNYGKTIFDLVYLLNSRAKHKLAVNFSQFAFENKECREFLEAARGIHSNDQLQAIRNLYKVLSLESPRYYPKSWKQFCMNIPEYLPGNFELDKYKALTNSGKQSGAESEAEKKARQLEAVNKELANAS